MPKRPAGRSGATLVQPAPNFAPAGVIYLNRSRAFFISALYIAQARSSRAGFACQPGKQIGSSLMSARLVGLVG